MKKATAWIIVWGIAIGLSSWMVPVLALWLLAVLGFSLPYHRMPRSWRGPWKGVWRWPWV